ncbi:hypothetical protein QFZ33_002312 [Arthrobacter globiformis]|nr:hypothetical protein [Arthrobacter globiformis]
MLRFFVLKAVRRALPGRESAAGAAGSSYIVVTRRTGHQFTLFLIPVLTTSWSYRFTCSNCALDVLCVRKPFRNGADSFSWEMEAPASLGRRLE